MRVVESRISPRPPALWPFLLVAVLVTLMLTLSVVWLNGQIDRGERIREAARASYNHRIDVMALLSTMRSAETSQRGYIIAGNPEFKGQYAASKQRIAAMIDREQRNPQLSPERRARLAELAGIIDAKIEEMDALVVMKDAEDENGVHARFAAGEGKRLMDRFESVVDRITANEEAIGAKGVADFTDRSRRNQRLMWTIVGCGGVTLLMALLTLWWQRRRQYQIELRRFCAAERNHAVLDSTVDAILIINPSGTIETINPAATAMLGYRAFELERRDVSVISDVAPGSANFSERIGLVNGMLKKQFFTDRVVRDRSGQPVSVDIALGVMALPDGDYVVMSLRDISERKRLEQLKDGLISTVSHELRTPLTSIVGALGLLGAEVGGKQTEQGARLIEIAENNSRRLMRLINDMLDLDRIGSGKLRMVMRPMTLGETVRRACDDSQGLASPRGVSLACGALDDTTRIMGDPDRLMQVIANLVSNALKVTPEGGTVMVGTLRDDVNRRITVFVDDEGPGVPEEFRARIFGRFERAVGDEGSAGTGLGLAIAREIVTQHGGEVWFEDRRAGGSRFAFALPIAAPVEVSDAIEDDTKILICERDPHIARELQAALVDEGYECRVVGSAAAARAALDGNGYTVLLLDMALHDEDAFKLARDVRSVEGPDKLSILLLSPIDRARPGMPLPLDLVDWIEKPVDAKRVKKAIWAVLPRGKIERPVVLHLDDDQDTLDVTAEALGDAAEILKARTLDEARALLHSASPHIAILDIHLKTGTGIDLLPDLVQASGVAVPTIIYSAHDVGIDVSSRVDAVLTKSPTSLPDLKATIRRVVTTRHGGKQGA